MQSVLLNSDVIVWDQIGPKSKEMMLNAYDSILTYSLNLHLHFYVTNKPFNVLQFSVHIVYK
jgi:hypothetical protein